MKRLFKGVAGVILAVSLLLNIVFGVYSLILQPAVYAAELTENAIKIRASERILRQKAVAKVRAAERVARLNAVSQVRVKERTARTKAVATIKARARVRRTLVAIPFAGVGVAGYFEYSDFQDWQTQNTGASFTDYLAKVGSETEEVYDDVVAGIPEKILPTKEDVTSKLSTWLEAASGLVSR